MSYAPGQRVEITFPAGIGNVLASLQSVKVLPSVGTLNITIEGFGGAGGGGGGQGGGAANGVGGGGSGGCLYQTGSFVHDLSHRLDIIIGLGGTPGAAGAAPAGAGGPGGDGGRSYALDFTTNVILFALSGSSGGEGGATIGAAPGRGGASYPGQVFVPRSVPGFMLAGGGGGLANDAGDAGQNGVTSQLIVAAGPNFLGAQGGLSGAGEGGGGGGGGGGIFAPPSPGGHGALAGSPGGSAGGAAPNSGAGVGGGAGGAGAADNGGAGGTGPIGWVKISFIVP